VIVLLGVMIGGGGEMVFVVALVFVGRMLLMIVMVQYLLQTQQHVVSLC